MLVIYLMHIKDSYIKTNYIINVFLFLEILYLHSEHQTKQIQPELGHIQAIGAVIHKIIFLLQ